MRTRAIVVGVDGTDSSSAAVRWATHGAHLVIVGVPHHGAVAGVFAGSADVQLLQQHADCPVYINHS